jgi:hypothetical protein
VSVLQSQQFADYQFVVPCVHHTTKTHKPDAKTGKCPLYPSIECSVHDQMSAPGCSAGYTPASFILDPDGKVIFDAEAMKGAGSIGATVKKLDEAVQKVGKGLPRAEYDKVLHEIEAADKDLAADKVEKAVRSLKKLADSKTLPASMKEGRVKAKLAEVEAKGQAILDDAKAKHDASPDEAMKLVKKVVSQWKGLEVAKAAGELEKEWEGAAGGK